MTATEAITHLPGGNGTLGFAQIHGPGSTWYLYPRSHWQW